MWLYSDMGYESSIWLELIPLHIWYVTDRMAITYKTYTIVNDIILIDFQKRASEN